MMALMDENDYIIRDIPMHIDLDESPTRQLPSQISKMQSDAVSCLHKIETKSAKYLSIYDITCKLKVSNDYDIGGTYDPDPELWFYFTTSVCPGYNYLLNLFVCHRKVGNCLIRISNSSEVVPVNTTNEFAGRSELPETFQTYAFRSMQPNVNHYIKTFCFSQRDVEILENTTLYIPINITTGVTSTLDPVVLRRIKLSHDFGNLLTDKEKIDFVIQSKSGKKFDVHKIILVAHSSVLRSAIKTLKEPLLKLDINNEQIGLLLEFLYTGTIKELLNIDSLKLLVIAERFQLQNLFKLVQFAISRQIKVNNAVEILVLSEKYKLLDLEEKVLKFIKGNPRVLESEGWLKLDNVLLTKKMFEYIYNSKKE